MKILVVTVCFCFSTLFHSNAQSSKSIKVPLDHKDAQTIQVEIEVRHDRPFEPSKPSLVVLSTESEWDFGHIFKTEQSSEDFNIVRFSGRAFSPKITKMIERNGEINWRNAYQWLNSDQQARDLELLVRSLSKTGEVFVIGHSGSAHLLIHYLSLFPESISKAAVLNPALFEVQNNLGFSWTSDDITSKLNSKRISNWIDPAKLLQFDKDNPPLTQTSSLALSYLHYLQFGFLFNYLVPSQHSNLGKQVRLFEISFGLQSDSVRYNSASKTLEWMKSESKGIWDSFSASPFEVEGTNFDNLNSYGGSVLLIGSTNDCYINPSVYDAIAEFLPETTLLAIADNHLLTKFALEEKNGTLLESFFIGSRVKFLENLEKLKKKGLLFSGSQSIPNFK